MPPASAYVVFVLLGYMGCSSSLLVINKMGEPGRLGRTILPIYSRQWRRAKHGPRPVSLRLSLNRLPPCYPPAMVRFPFPAAVTALQYLSTAIVAYDYIFMTAKNSR